MNTLQIPKIIARNIVEQAGNGIPPKNGYQYYTVGIDKLVQAIDKEYLETFIKQGGSSFKIVLGHYGEGKTHFLYVIENIAKENNYVTSFINLSMEETPFHKIELVYKKIVQNLEIQNSLEKGISIIITKWLKEKIEQGISDDVLLAEIDSMPIEYHNYKIIIKNAIKYLLKNEEDVYEEVILPLLLGEGLSKRDIKDYGIYETLNNKNAFSWFRSLIQFIKSIGYSGIVVLFDEAEPVSSLSSKDKSKLLNNLRLLIDEAATSNLPSCMIFYAVPDLNFLEGRDYTYQALSQRIKGDGQYLNELIPQANVLNLELIVKNEDFYKELSNKLKSIYEVAYDYQFSEEENQKIQEEVDKMVLDLLNSVIEEGFKRKFIRNYIHLLNKLRNNKNKV
ncbi:MAG: hypothetical protein KatS3mg129_2204 [Leptospiraceae bacterium]|nr:MAG: hypothetical protein KatS3mg129_2204 [Leptospiraceae bacterium]